MRRRTWWEWLIEFAAALPLLACFAVWSDVPWWQELVLVAALVVYVTVATQIDRRLRLVDRYEWVCRCGSRLNLDTPAYGPVRAIQMSLHELMSVHTCPDDLRSRVRQLAIDVTEVETSTLGEWDEGYRDACSDVIGLINEPSHTDGGSVTVGQVLGVVLVLGVLFAAMGLAGGVETGGL